ncbi:hypothetical protein LHV02_00430 [Limosilactobacillus fermentum]|uniref:hypothetical protein n=2 Tax=Bacteria TaxID=2 RepID=UPI0016583F13|nr:hypothetical protein [Limosilactobacillus fermentum]MBC9021208.1 hypothetical protein [Limosilactobacillus fermentum CECT 5716]MCB4715026.1 hypothetical protein [Limosilactobacillus fermentum]MCH5396643.1 hypothetical protein [Limosilactobacillus fermentum]
MLNSKIPMGVIAGLDQEAHDNCGEPIPPKSEEWITTYGKQAAIGALNEFRRSNILNINQEDKYRGLKMDPANIEARRERRARVKRRTDAMFAEAKTIEPESIPTFIHKYHQLRVNYTNIALALGMERQKVIAIGKGIEK